MANVDRLEETLDHIRMNREEHDQCFWATKSEGCGTTMCFAGTTVALAGYELDWCERAGRVGHAGRSKVVGSFAEHCIVPEGHYCGSLAKPRVEWVAAYELGLTDVQAEDLFYGAKTFDDVERTVKDIINAEQAAA